MEDLLPFRTPEKQLSGTMKLTSKCKPKRNLRVWYVSVTINITTVLHMQQVSKVKYFACYINFMRKWRL